MKVSVSLPDEDLEFLDRYAAKEGIGSRSAVLHRAVRLLRSAELGPAYEQAWAEWADDDTSNAWESTAGDGIS